MAKTEINSFEGGWVQIPPTMQEDVRDKIMEIIGTTDRCVFWRKRVGRTMITMPEYLSITKIFEGLGVTNRIWVNYNDFQNEFRYAK